MTPIFVKNICNYYKILRILRRFLLIILCNLRLLIKYFWFYKKKIKIKHKNVIDCLIFQQIYNLIFVLFYGVLFLSL